MPCYIGVRTYKLVVMRESLCHRGDETGWPKSISSGAALGATYATFAILSAVCVSYKKVVTCLRHIGLSSHKTSTKAFGSQPDFRLRPRE